MSEPLAPRARILLVEDEPSLVLTLSDRLRAERYEVESATDGTTALARAAGGSFDLVILDVMLPDIDGFEVCRRMRADGLETPVLMLTARQQVIDRVLGLRLGADDYLTKPFEVMELLARIDALLRRTRSSEARPQGTYLFGDLRVDFARAEVTKGGSPVPLSAMEYRLLTYLIGRRGEVIGRDELLDRVWDYDATPQTRTVDVHIASLRRKIESNPARPSHIVTVHRLGYKLVVG